MSNDTTPKILLSTSPPSKWFIALLVSIAVNGLLGGLLWAKQIHPVQPMSGAEHQPGQISGQNSNQAAQNDPRHLVRILPPKRRKQVMKKALEHLKLQGAEHPRHLFKQLRQARGKTMNLLSADELDIKAIEISMAETRALNQKMAISGDALILEVLAQMTPQERALAKQASKTRKENRRRMQKRMRKRQERQ